MAIKQVFNPLTGDFDMVDVVDTSTLVGKTVQNVTTTDALLTPVSGSVEIPTDTNVLFKTTIVGRQTLDTPATEGADDNQYNYEVIGSIKNVGGTLTLGEVDGVIYQEDTVLPIDATTGHTVNITFTGTTLDYGIQGLDGTILWEFETVFTEV